jgi:hypothetical protein
MDITGRTNAGTEGESCIIIMTGPVLKLKIWVHHKLVRLW